MFNNVSRNEEESNTNISYPIETPQSQNENKSTNSDETLAQLVAMGFEPSIAQIAVVENKDQGFDAILQWLLRQQNDINSQNEYNELSEEIKGKFFSTCNSLLN
jgi:hypothetical protein